MDQLDQQVHDLTKQKSQLESATPELTAGISDSAVVAVNAKRYDELKALEKAINDKRAERDLKKHELEAEFAAVFGEIKEKKTELKTLEASIREMEAQRLRKDREFNRLQRNLMELLAEQKAELDAIREKGLQLETATSTAAGTAHLIQSLLNALTPCYACSRAYKWIVWCVCSRCGSHCHCSQGEPS